MNADENLRARLDEALSECQRLREENDSLRNSLGLAKRDVASPDNSISISLRETRRLTNESPRQAKLELFRSIFRGREDIYAQRWENKKGASGYSPACRHEWNKLFCQKPALKCSRCKNRDLLPLTDEVILDHLTGKQTVGIYPLLPDETCCFLAIDFDKDCWRQDIAAVLNTCHELSVPAIVERSRSGAGGHLWIFFDQPVTSTLARSLGSGLLTRTMERHRFGLDSYDRLFPNQDTMPKGDLET